MEITGVRHIDMLTVKTMQADVDVVTGFDCDRCGKHTKREEAAFYDALPIRWETGKKEAPLIELTFCQKCAWELMYPYVLIKEQEIH